jgi:hypothetical protein
MTNEQLIAMREATGLNIQPRDTAKLIREAIERDERNEERLAKIRAYNAANKTEAKPMSETMEKWGKLD